MLRIAITTHHIHPREPQIITSLLRDGWTYVHLRHPDASLRDIQNIIEAIPQKYHSRIKLHGHFELVHSFNLGGLHLNSRCPTPPVGYSDKLSRSCHTPQELSQATGLEYTTLSPVYPSISKPGYLPVLTTDQIISALAEAKVPVVALGGVTPDKESELMHMGFAGYACLGSVWQQFSDK